MNNRGTVQCLKCDFASERGGYATRKHPTGCRSSARVLFAMAYRGKGIICSAIGTNVICASVQRRCHPLEKPLGFQRAHSLIGQPQLDTSSLR